MRSEACVARKPVETVDIDPDVSPDDLGALRERHRWLDGSPDVDEEGLQLPRCAEDAGALSSTTPPCTAHTLRSGRCAQAQRQREGDDDQPPHAHVPVRRRLTDDGDRFGPLRFRLRCGGFGCLADADVRLRPDLIRGHVGRGGYGCAVLN